MKRILPVTALFLFAATARADVAAEVHFGHGGGSVAGAITRLVVDLDSREKEPLDVLVSGRIPGSTSSGVLARASVRLGAGARQRVTLFFRPSARARYRLSLAFDRAVALTLPDGERLKPARSHSLEQGPVQGYALESPVGVQILAVGPRAGLLPEPPSGVRILPVDEAELPEVFAAYDSLDAVYWRNPGESAPLDPVRTEALLRWVSLGGRLIVATRRPDRLRGTDLDAALPADYDRLPRGIDYDLVATRYLKVITGGKDIAGLGVGPFLTLRRRPSAIEERNVFSAERRLGLGSVTLLAFDPAEFRDVDEDLGARLLASMVGARPDLMASGGLSQAIETLELGYIIGDSSDRDYFEAFTRLLRTEALRAPPMGLLSLFMVLYVLAVGPIDYYILKKRGLLKYSALTFLGIAVLFTATAYFVSFYLFSGGVRVNRLTFVDLVPGPGEGEVDRVLLQDFAGFYEPTGGTPELSPPGDIAVLSQFDRPQDYVEGGMPRLLADPLVVDLTSPLRPVGELTVPFRSLRRARTVSYRERTMPLSVLMDPGQSVTVRNDLGFLLRDGVLVSSTEAIYVGDVPDGEEVAAEWIPRSLSSQAFQHRWMAGPLPDANEIEVDESAPADHYLDTLSRTARSLQTICAARCIARLGEDSISRGQLSTLAKWGIDRSPHLDRGGYLFLAWTEERGAFGLPGDDEEGLTINVLRKVVTP